MEKALRKNQKNTFKLRRNNKQIFDKKELFLLQQPLKQIQKGTKIDFVIGEETFINTTDKKITKSKLILVMIMDFEM